METSAINFNTPYGVIVEQFGTIEAAEKARAEVLKYEKEWAAVIEKMDGTGLNFHTHFKGFCARCQRVHVSFLSRRDEPQIFENGVYITFKVDLETRTVEAGNCGCIDLTDADRRKSYLCMCTMKMALEAAGGKWFRKQGFKDAAGLASKIQKFCGVMLDALEKTTEGYPYRKMAVNIY